MTGQNDYKHKCQGPGQRRALFGDTVHPIDEIDGKLLESGVVVFFILEPLEQFMVSADNDLLTVIIMVVHWETVNNGEAFTFHHTIAGLSISSGDPCLLGHFVQRKIELLFVSVAWEQFIECGWFMISQITVQGGSCNLKI
uniref:Uncharacterized protein n=1 Tax=Romanomermis culicivorax TaxID=13658 RepID=A0A915KF78_ROMCU